MSAKTLLMGRKKSGKPTKTVRAFVQMAEDLDFVARKFDQSVAEYLEEVLGPMLALDLIEAKRIEAQLLRARERRGRGEKPARPEREGARDDD
jgi:hypothetical protein